MKDHSASIWPQNSLRLQLISTDPPQESRLRHSCNDFVVHATYPSGYNAGLWLSCGRVWGAHGAHMCLTCWSHASYMLVTCWSHASHMLVTCVSHAGHMRLTCWSHACHVLGACRRNRLFTCSHMHREATCINIIFKAADTWRLST